jgi:trehalose 6-phosphate synthase
VIANPILWFIQHYLWDLSNAPDIRQEELDAWDYGYQAVNRDIADAVVAQIAGQEQPLVMLHDYHLYTAPRMIREQRPDVFLHHFVHIPWSQPDSWRVLPTRIREAVFDGLLANDIIGFHTVAYCINFLRCCDELLEAEVDYANGEVRHAGGETWPAPTRSRIDAERLRAGGRRRRGGRGEREVLERPARAPDHPRRPRRPLEERAARLHRLRHFLSSTPSSAREVTFIAHLQPSRQDVPEYAEYLGADRGAGRGRQPPPRHHRLDADRPAIYENFPEAVARYKHFDLLMVNSIFDGMNLSPRRRRRSTPATAC